MFEVSAKNGDLTRFAARVWYLREVISRQNCGDLDGTALLALPRITSRVDSLFVQNFAFFLLVWSSTNLFMLYTSY